MDAEYNGHKFNDSHVVIDDATYLGEYNPHNVRPWLIYNEFGTLAVVFASHEGDALDAAVDAGKLDCQQVSEEDFAAMSEEEREELIYLGNASEPFDQTYLGIVELPLIARSFAAEFARRQP